MKKLISIIVLFILAITISMNLFSISSALAESDIYLKVENFTWKEFDDTGKQLLKESGPIYGIGISGKTDTKKLIILTGKIEVFGGSINYDGQTQSGTPVKTDTAYFGAKLEGDLGLGFIIAEKLSIEPFAGLGFRFWNRELRSTATARGYDESWFSSYSRLGIRSNLIVLEKTSVFIEGGVKLPIYNEYEIDMSKLYPLGLPGVIVNPGNETSKFAEVGFKCVNLKVSLFYEGMRFSKSDTVWGGFGITVWQPKSTADIYGIKLGAVF